MFEFAPLPLLAAVPTSPCTSTLHTQEAQQHKAALQGAASACASAAASSAISAASPAFTTAIATICEFTTLFASTRDDVDSQIMSMATDLKIAQDHAAQTRAEIASEAAALKALVGEVAGGFRGACSEAVRRVQNEVEAKLKLDSQLASLGPGGLDGLCEELHKVRADVALMLYAPRYVGNLNLHACHCCSWLIISDDRCSDPMNA